MKPDSEYIEPKLLANKLHQEIKTHISSGYLNTDQTRKALSVLPSSRARTAFESLSKGKRKTVIRLLAQASYSENRRRNRLNGSNYS